MKPLFAGIDAGGTAFKCIVAAGPDQILAEHKVPVTTPGETLALCAAFFREHQQVAALGIASFGPIERNRAAAAYGRITTTPKPGWANTDVVGYFAAALKLPIAFDTDVNGALLAEHRWGAAQGFGNAVYITIGTGIGVGAMCEARLLHGAMHPEAGHMRVAKLPGDHFAGVCPFHGDCVEGLASGPALAARLGCDAAAVGDHHAIWQTLSHYWASLCMNLALCYSPERIVLGGGVMQRTSLSAIIRASTNAQLHGYLAGFDAATVIQPAALGQRAGALGAIALAQSLSRQDA